MFKPIPDCPMCGSKNVSGVDSEYIIQYEHLIHYKCEDCTHDIYRKENLKA